MNGTALQFWPAMRRVERTAWNAIVRCIRSLRLEQLPLPIPVEQWIEGPLGVRLTVTDLSGLGPDVLGRAKPREREIEISESLVDQDARFRFTAAHELGHVLLHARLAADFRDGADGDYMERRVEREADRFAAAFLMPIPALCVVLAEAATKVREDAHALLAGAQAGDQRMRDVLRSRVFPHMARRFGASLTALVHRFSDVQLPNGEPAIAFEAGLALLPSSHIPEAIRRR